MQTKYKTIIYIVLALLLFISGGIATGLAVRSHYIKSIRQLDDRATDLELQLADKTRAIGLLAEELANVSTGSGELAESASGIADRDRQTSDGIGSISGGLTDDIQRLSDLMRSMEAARNGTGEEN